MPVTIQLENPCLTAVLDGEIDHHCARSLREEIDQAILDYEPHQLRLDFEKVTFMDSRCRLVPVMSSSRIRPRISAE